MKKSRIIILLVVLGLVVSASTGFICTHSKTLTDSIGTPLDTIMGLCDSIDDPLDSIDDELMDSIDNQSLVAENQSDESQKPSDSVDVLDEFLKKNPYAIDVNLLTEGTKAYICGDDRDLFVRVSVGNPMLFMRMLMQGLTIYIDPTGRNKDKYSVCFPSARDVQDILGNNEPSGPQESDQQERPDLTNLLNAMNTVGAKLDINGRRYPLGQMRTWINLDKENEVIDFYVLVPKERMMREKRLASNWSLGIFLDTPDNMGENDRRRGPGNNGMMQQRPPQRDDRPQSQDQEDLMTKRIKTWVKFSIDDANNVNLN